MIQSDLTLDNITLDSADIQTIERFENNYYNHKNKLLQSGSNNNKLENDIVRLYNCFILSQNQNQDELSHKIKKRFNKKFVELKNLEGGVVNAVIITGLKKILHPEYEKLDPFLDKSLEILKMDSIKKLFKNIMNNPNFKTIILNNIITIVKILNNITLETAKIPINEMTNDNIVDKVIETVYNNKKQILPLIKVFVKELFAIINPKIDEIMKEELISKLINELVNEFGSFGNVITSIFGSSSSIEQQQQQQQQSYASEAPKPAPKPAAKPAAKPATTPAAAPVEKSGWFSRNKK